MRPPGWLQLAHCSRLGLRKPCGILRDVSSVDRAYSIRAPEEPLLISTSDNSRCAFELSRWRGGRRACDTANIMGCLDVLNRSSRPLAKSQPLSGLQATIDSIRIADRIRRKRHRLPSNDPIKTAPPDCPRSYQLPSRGSPDRVLTFIVPNPNTFDHYLGR